MNGKQSWFIVDGYRPALNKNETKGYIGHESIMILNCNDADANVLIDIYFADKEPIKNIRYTAPANRISAFRSDDESVLSIKLGIGEQYSLRVRSDVGVVVQYGRMDINQSNLAYLATLGFGE